MRKSVFDTDTACVVAGQKPDNTHSLIPAWLAISTTFL